jgi:hypothetical protein
MHISVDYGRCYKERRLSDMRSVVGQRSLGSVLILGVVSMPIISLKEAPNRS